MTEKEELLLALSILRKHNLPVSPILEYEINERFSKQIDVSRNEEEVSIAAEPVVFEKKKIILSGNSIKERFETYLYNRKSQNTVKNYIGILNKPIRNY